MSEFIKVSAKTVEDAIIEASIQLGASSDNLEYHVLEKETKGFLGFGAKKAVIEVRKKNDDEDIIGDVFHKKSEKRIEKEVKKEIKDFKKEIKKDEKIAEKEDKKAAKEVKREVKKDNSKKKQSSGRIEAADKNDLKKESQKTADFSVKEEKQEEEAKPKTPVDGKEAEQKAVDFLTRMFETMDMKVTVSAVYENEVLSVDIEGDDMGVLIGKRGQTLDSIQYLVSLVVNKGKSSYIRVKLDTENYRNRRKATLENLAKNIAFKVKKTRRPVYLEPMNPYERRIIHSALQNDPYVTTHSEGEEPNRKVVVTLRKRERNSFQNKENKEVKENKEIKEINE